MTDAHTHDIATRQPGPTEHASDLQRNAQNRIQREKAQLLHDWTIGGGIVADFEATWPAIRAQLSQIRLMELGDKARNRSLAAFHKRA